eukprot:scaffold4790_cov98-Cylindrotheca_fusiformis.AAC.11
MDERNSSIRKKSKVEKAHEPELFFVYTSETKDAEIPRKVTHLLVDSSVREIPEEAFQFCGELVHVQLPKGLTRIGKDAFFYCTSLRFVQFVSEGSLETFNPNLEEGTIVFPERATPLQMHRAFPFCFCFRKVIVCSNSTKLGAGVFFSCRSLISVELPEGLQVIEQQLFVVCESLSIVKIPSSVIEIGERAFDGCSSLTSVDLPPGLLEIGELAFRSCDSMESLHIPSTVSSIRKGAFESCSRLKHIKLPPTLERIESEMFQACRSLEYIEIPSTVYFIGRGAFNSCRSLSHIRIPPTCQVLWNFAFEHCDNLISIEFPEGILSNVRFDGCTSLMNLAGQSLHFSSTCEFFQNQKLGSVVDREVDCGSKLKNRFNHSPLNKLCYYQSYHPEEDAMAKLHSMMEDDPLAATCQVDGLGMTPLHVISLSQTPSMELLLALMKGGHLEHIIHGKDSFGHTPMDYLCLNRMPNSSDVIRRVLQTRFDYLLASAWSGKSDTMWQAVDKALAVDWSSRSTEVGKVYVRFANYERRMKVASLVELCLWKIKIEEVCSKEQTADRESCRINCGACVVIPYLLPFLDKIDREDCVVSAS